MQAGRRGRRPLRVRNRMCGSDRRDDVGIVPYAGFIFSPVGRGQCAPPLEVRCVSAAAHMGAALQRNLQNMRRGGGSAPPVHGHRIFIKMSFRGAQRRGNPFSLCGEGAAQGTGYGLPHRCARWFAMTGNFFGGAVHIGGGVRAPRPTENIFNIKCKKTDRIAPVCFFMGLLNFTDCPARRLRLRGGWARCRWSRW